MAKSMAASMTAAVGLGYDSARRCDSYGSHACCVPGGHTLWALEVWPESHRPGFTLRQADVFQSIWPSRACKTLQYPPFHR